ncbi:plasmid mobilization relaxosome protein MobC [Pseudarthrobacter sp. NPDC080037]|uniref:plasmid mobilization relaxosome protein MobC n=2 Tax=unclassified Pseudarthrobacter TaxID=2647000 RepID=UPI00344D7139
MSIHGLRALIGDTEGVGPEIPGRCAGHVGEGHGMSEEPKSFRRFARRRRANIDGATQYVRVSMSEFERAQLKVLEERTGRSPSEILVSAALYAENSESLAERRAMAVEFIAARRYLAALSNNVNQLARHANAMDEFPEAARTVLTRVRAVADRINSLLDSLVR